MRELFLLFGIRMRSAMTGALDFRWGSVAKNLSSVIIFGGFAVGVFFLARGSTFYLLTQAHIGQYLFHRFLSMLLYVFFVTVNLGNIVVCYATLYKSEEVKFLMGLPVPHETIFLMKFVDNFFYSSTTLTLLGTALLLGYGSYFGFPWYFYVLTIFGVLLPFMLIAGIVAVIILMSLIKIAARIGIRRLLAIIGTVYGSAIYIYFHITNPVQLVQEVMKHYPDVNAYFGYLDPPFVRYLPNHWVAEFLYWTVNGEVQRAASFLLVLCGTMAGLIIAAGLMARKIYYDSWLMASDARAMRGGGESRVKLGLLEFGRRGAFRAQTDVLLKRDFWIFLRDPNQWLHMTLMALLLVIFLVSLGSFDMRITQAYLQVATFLVVFLFNGFLVASVSLRFVFPAVSLEGVAFWSVRTSPLSLKKLFWHKFTFSFGLVLIVAEVLSVVSALMMWNNLLLVAVSALCTLFVALALTSVNLGAGAYFAVYGEKNPIRVASSQGASLTFLGCMAYLAVVVAILFVPLHRYFESVIIRGVSFSSWSYVPLLSIGLLSAIVFSVSSSIGVKSLERDY